MGIYNDNFKKDWELDSKMKITFLGTASMQPTKERNLSATLVSYKSENILIDCGEGTQRQMMIKGLKVPKLTKILISHWHGDHVIGLMGIIQNLKANEFKGNLDIYGPNGTKKYFESMLNSFIFKSTINIKIHEIREGIIFEDGDYKIEAFKLNHSVPCFGYSIIEKDIRKINVDYLKKFGLKTHPLVGKLQKGEDIVWNGNKISAKKATFMKKGKKLSFILDSGLCSNCYKIAKDATLLICESTYLHTLESKAVDYKHLTAIQAAEIAKKSNAYKLILTHFSQRYKNVDIIKKEASKVFKNVECAEDFMEIKL